MKLMALSNVFVFKAKTKSLRSLNLGQNRIGDLGIQKIKPGLIRNRSLRKLGLLNTKLGNEGNFNCYFGTRQLILQCTSFFRTDRQPIPVPKSILFWCIPNWVV